MVETPEGRNLEAGPDALFMEEFCLLACFRTLLTLLSCSIQNYHQRVSTTCVSWTLAINHQPRKCSSVLFTDQSGQKIFSLEFSSSEMTLVVSSWHTSSENCPSTNMEGHMHLLHIY